MYYLSCNLINIYTVNKGMRAMEDPLGNKPDMSQHYVTKIHQQIKRRVYG